MIIRKLPLSLVVVVLLSFIHGLVYLVLMPPWQHYEEPTHFEYAWLLAKWLRIPQPGEYDPEMRREVAQSMIDNDFYVGMNALPDLDVANGKVDIGGYSQLDEPVGYYLLVAIPIRFLLNQPVTVQLYSARLISVGLLVVSLCAIYGLVHELTLPGSPLRWIIPGGVALLPGYVELMSAINNDVGAAAFMALVLWGATRLVKRGWNLWTWLCSGAAMVVSLSMKETAYLALPIWLLATTLAIFRKGWIRVAWVGIALGFGFALITAFGWGDAYLWYRATDQTAGTRLQNVAAPLGEAVFTLNLEQTGDIGWGNFQINQLIPGEINRNIRGQVVTVGAWMWADEPLTIPMPVLSAIKADRGVSQAYFPVEISTVPTFYAYVTSVPEDTYILQLNLGSREQSDLRMGSLYFDSVVMASGEYPTDEAPVWKEYTAERGIWGGIEVVNLIRNASAEISGPRIKPWIDRLGSMVTPDHGRPSLVLYSLLDQQAGGSYYRQTAKTMLQTFWGRFGWGHVLLDGKAIYNILTWVTIAGMVGCCAVFWIKLPPYQISTLALLGLAIIGVWSVALIRGAIYLFNWPFIPGARYAFPVVGPTMGLIGYGLWNILSLVGKVLKLKTGVIVAVMGLFMLFLDVWSVISIWGYYAA